MPLFKSTRERRNWLFALIVMVAIFSTLFMGRPFQEFLRDQNVQAIFFLASMALTAIAVLVHGLNTKPGKVEISIWVGLAAVYIMLFLRLGITERSHLIEYSVLALFIHKAFIERFSQEKKWIPALFALVLSCLIGIIDETLQLFLPNRVFDPVDILFNCLAALMAISASLLLQWGRKKAGF